MYRSGCCSASASTPPPRSPCWSSPATGAAAGLPWYADPGAAAAVRRRHEPVRHPRRRVHERRLRSGRSPTRSARSTTTSPSPGCPSRSPCSSGPSNSSASCTTSRGLTRPRQRPDRRLGPRQRRLPHRRPVRRRLGRSPSATGSSPTSSTAGPTEDQSTIARSQHATAVGEITFEESSARLDGVQAARSLELGGIVGRWVVVTLVAARSRPLGNAWAADVVDVVPRSPRPSSSVCPPWCGAAALGGAMEWRLSTRRCPRTPSRPLPVSGLPLTSPTSWHEPRASTSAGPAAPSRLATPSPVDGRLLATKGHLPAADDPVVSRLARRTSCGPSQRLKKRSHVGILNERHVSTVVLPMSRGAEHAVGFAVRPRRWGLACAYDQLLPDAGTIAGATSSCCMCTIVNGPGRTVGSPVCRDGDENGMWGSRTDARDQTLATMRNIESILVELGGSLTRLVRVMIYVICRDDEANLGQAWEAYVEVMVRSAIDDHRRSDCTWPSPRSRRAGRNRRYGVLPAEDGLGGHSRLAPHRRRSEGHEQDGHARQSGRLGKYRCRLVMTVSLHAYQDGEQQPRVARTGVHRDRGRYAASSRGRLCWRDAAGDLVGDIALSPAVPRLSAARERATSHHPLPVGRLTYGTQGLCRAAGGLDGICLRRDPPVAASDARIVPGASDARIVYWMRSTGGTLSSDVAALAESRRNPAIEADSDLSSAQPRRRIAGNSTYSREAKAPPGWVGWPWFRPPRPGPRRRGTDPAGLGLLGDRDPQGEHAAVVAGGDPFGVEVVAQDQLRPNPRSPAGPESL